MSSRLGVVAWLGGSLQRQHGHSLPLDASQQASREDLQAEAIEFAAWSRVDSSVVEPVGDLQSTDAFEDDDAEQEDTPEQTGHQFPSPEAPLLAVPIVGQDRSRHPEFQVLTRLAKQLSDGAWSGDVFLYVDRVPCVSCFGALIQLRRKWPNISIRASFDSGPEEPQECHQACPDPIGQHPASQLAEAIRRCLRANPIGQGTQAPVSLVGEDPRVRGLWARVCATGLRPSGKRPGKKREWHDKLKNFLAHWPVDFRVFKGDKDTMVCLLGPDGVGEPTRDEAKSAAAFKAFVDVLEQAIADKLRSSKGIGPAWLRGAEGFVPVEDIIRRPEVKRAWKFCQAGPWDKPAYFLRHCAAFEVWDPLRQEPKASASGATNTCSTSIALDKEDSGAAEHDVDLRSRVRLWP